MYMRIGLRESKSLGCRLSGTLVGSTRQVTLGCVSDLKLRVFVLQGSGYGLGCPADAWN